MPASGAHEVHEADAHDVVPVIAFGAQDRYFDPNQVLYSSGSYKHTTLKAGMTVSWRQWSELLEDLQRGQAFSATLATCGLPLPEYVVQLARALGTTIEDLLSSAGYYDKPIRALPDLSVYLRQVTTLDSRSIQEVLDFIEFKEKRLRGRLEHAERLRGVS